jgi:hypothetical protein
MTTTKATPENGGHALVKAATRKLPTYEIPANWRDYIVAPKDSEPSEHALAKILPPDGLLIVDPAYLSLPSRDAGNVFAQGEMLARISDLCQSANTTLILCHHFKKNTGRDTYDVPELDDLSWSGFSEFARQYVLVGRREKYKQDGEHKLWATIGGSVGHSHLLAIDITEGVYVPGLPRRWEIQVASPHEIREREKDAKEHEEKEDILIVLRDLYPDGETASEISRLAKVGKGKIKTLLESLAKESKIVECDVRKKQTHLGYRLADAEASRPAA